MKFATLIQLVVHKKKSTWNTALCSSFTADKKAPTSTDIWLFLQWEKMSLAFIPESNDLQ